MALTQKHIDDICLNAKPGQCRYLGDDLGGNFYCLKKIALQKAIIDNEVEEFIRRHKAKGADPYAMGVPLGDNCGGFRLLKAKQQGYDIDGKIP